MKTRVRAALAGLVAALFAAAVHADPTVIVLSWDGVRHDAPDRTPVPVFERLAADGLRAARLEPVFPSNTFPGHVSLATGTYPDRHGIVDNRFLDRERGAFSMSNDASWIQAEPIWITAERQGVVAATYFWVGSETPWQGIAATHRMAPFDSGIDEETKVDQILAWLALPEPERPRLVMSWWHGSDRAGHRSGPDHADVAEALAGQSRALERLLAALDARDAWRDTTLLLVSDHGMTRVRRSLDVQAALDVLGVEARVGIGSSVAHVFLANPDDPDAMATAERALGLMDHVEHYRGRVLPPELRLRHPTRTGDWVVIAEPGGVFRRDAGLRFWRLLRRLVGGSTGIHGYRPAHPDMGAIFFALGRGVTAGRRLDTVRMIDVAPTIAALLGIEPPRHAEGRPIALHD